MMKRPCVGGGGAGRRGQHGQRRHPLGGGGGLGRARAAGGRRPRQIAGRAAGAHEWARWGPKRAREGAYWAVIGRNRRNWALFGRNRPHRIAHGPHRAGFGRPWRPLGAGRGWAGCARGGGGAGGGGRRRRPWRRAAWGRPCWCAPCCSPSSVPLAGSIDWGSAVELGGSGCAAGLPPGAGAARLRRAKGAAAPSRRSAPRAARAHVLRRRHCR